jgi:hypothetical protein
MCIIFGKIGELDESWTYCMRKQVTAMKMCVNPW